MAQIFHYDPTQEIDIFLLNEKATVPTRNHSTDAGLDLYSLEDVFIPIGSTVMVKTGIAVHVPTGYVGLLKERSSIGKKGLKAAGGVIDSHYSGDVSILLMNLSYDKDSHPVISDWKGYNVKAGERVAQILIVPIITPVVNIVNTLWSSERSDKSFGSSGK